MASVEDRLWRELVEDHGAKLAETPWPTPKGHIRRTILVGGAALAVCGAIAALVVGLSASSPSADAGITYIPPSKMVQELERELDLQAPIAEARIDNVLLVVAKLSFTGTRPPTARGLPISYVCFTTIGTGNGGATCGPPAGLDQTGTYLILGPPHGPWTSWGYAPVGTTEVTVDGRNFPLSGRFYRAIIPPGPQKVVLTTPTGLKTYPGP